MEVSPHSIADLISRKLLWAAPTGNVLWLSLRSLSLDKEMRFRLHRALLGHKQEEWPISALNSDLFKESIETLSSDNKFETFPRDHPPARVSERKYGLSLGCLDFKSTEDMSLAV